MYDITDSSLMISMKFNRPKFFWGSKSVLQGRCTFPKHNAKTYGSPETLASTVIVKKYGIKIYSVSQEHNNLKTHFKLSIKLEAKTMHPNYKT